MYNTALFEKAISICGYTLSRIHKGDSHFVRKAEGIVPIVKKVTINGIRQSKVYNKKVRWDAAGVCFSFYSNKRRRRYDLPLRTVYEDNLRKEAQRCM